MGECKQCGCSFEKEFCSEACKSDYILERSEDEEPSIDEKLELGFLMLSDELMED